MRQPGFSDMNLLSCNLLLFSQDDVFHASTAGSVHLGARARHLHPLLWPRGDDSPGWDCGRPGASSGGGRSCRKGFRLPIRVTSLLDPAGSVPGDWRDRAIRAGRPSTLLRHESLVAREAAAQQALHLQQAQVRVVLLLGMSP